MTTIEQNLPESVSSSPAKPRTATHFTFVDVLCMALVAAALFIGVSYMHKHVPAVYANAHVGITK